MATFQKAERAYFDPGRCFACGTSEGPMVEIVIAQFEVSMWKEDEDGGIAQSGRDVSDHGVATYLCIAPRGQVGCAQQIGHVAGLMAKAKSDELGFEVERLTGANLELADELVEAQSSRMKVVSVAEVLDAVSGS